VLTYQMKLYGSSQVQNKVPHILAHNMEHHIRCDNRAKVKSYTILGLKTAPSTLSAIH